MSIYGALRELTGGSERLRIQGDAARNLGDWPQAARFYGMYLDRVPDDAGIWVQLGHAQKEGGNLDLAERSYLRALSLDPGNPDTHVQLGHVEKLRGNLEQSVSRYRKALDIDPDFAAAVDEFRRLESDPLVTEANAPARKLAGCIVDEQRLDHLNERLGIVEDQCSVVKAIAFETQRMQRQANETERRLDEFTDRLAQVESMIEDFRASFADRLSRLETKSPPMQNRFSALLEYFEIIRVHQQELQRHADEISKLSRQAGTR